MKFIRLAAALLAAAVALGSLAGCSGSKKDPGLGGDAVKGKTLFVETCASCHADNGKGLPGSGKDLTKSTFADGLTDQDLLAFIQKGRPASDPLNTTGVEMPVRGGNPSLTDKDLADVIAHLRTLSVAKKK